MALAASDLISPLGEVQQSMFPNETLTDGATGIVDVLLAKALTLEPDNESKQEAFVYWKAYTAMANRFAAELMSEKRDKISRTRSAEQLNHWKSEAYRWEAKFEGSYALTIHTSACVENVLVW